MTVNDLKILLACKTLLRPVDIVKVTDVPLGTIYNAVVRLEKEGVLVRYTHWYKTTPSGILTALTELNALNRLNNY